MTEMIVKPVPFSEMSAVYMMGYETWNQGKAVPDYLEFCFGSEKLNAGNWYGLYSADLMISSLIVYQFDPQTFGFGSIATETKHRGQGAAPRLIQNLIDKINSDNPQASIFLYSDISPDYYLRFGFLALPECSQKYPKSVCMVRGNEIQKYLKGEVKPPEYF